MEFTSASAAVAGKKALESIVKDLCTAASGTVKNSMNAYRAKKKIDKLYSEIASIRNVKTIWKIDHPVDLLEFYYPTSIRFGYDSSQVIDNLSSLSGNLVIQGTAGQGKTIFLRYLCSQQLIEGKKIPVFLEIRRIKPDGTLQKSVRQRLHVLGFQAHWDLVDFFAKQGRLILLLDGFDELHLNRRRGLITEIEDLAALYKDMQIIIATRPGTEIIYSPFFDLASIAYIPEKDVPKVIYTITKGGELADLLVAALRRRSGEVMGVLNTPLLITLLIFTYQAKRIVPKRFSEFYEQLFPILIRRHDITKLGLSRERKCKISDERMEAIFDALCFLMRKKRPSTPTKRELTRATRQAIRVTRECCSTEAYLDDIVRVTNLILREGDQYSFVHRSVLEFHAASYVMKLEDEHRSELFYSEMRKGRWREWRPELTFLEEIDRFRYTKFFLLPELEAFFQKYAGRIPRTWERTPRSVIVRILQQYEVGWSRYDKGLFYYNTPSTADSWWESSKGFLGACLWECSRYRAVERNIETDKRAYLKNAYGNPVFAMRADRALETGYLDSKLTLKVVDRVFRNAFETLEKSKSYLVSTVDNDELIAF